MAVTDCWKRSLSIVGAILFRRIEQDWEIDFRVWEILCINQRKFVTFVTVRETRFDIKCFRENGTCWYILHSFETVSNHSQTCNVSGKVDFQELTAKPRDGDWLDLLSTCGFYSCYHTLSKEQKYPFSRVGLSLTWPKNLH